MNDRRGTKHNSNPCRLGALSSSLLIVMLLLLSALSSAKSNAGQEEKGPITVSAEQAEQNLVKKVAPVYPLLAKQARIQGTVKFRVVISKQGTIESANLVSGHPLLVQAAINAIKQWQYTPFLVDGQPAEASTEAEVVFSLGISDTEHGLEQKSNEAYFKREKECRSLLKAGAYSQAEAPCTSLAELVEKLPPERQNERRIANELAGEAMLRQKKFDPALSFFLNELAIAEVSLNPTDAELGYAYHHVAVGYHATGELQKAQSYYEKAEATLRAAREHIETESLKNEYAKAIQSVLRDYIALLRQTGQLEAAAKAEKRADAIARQIHP